MTTFKINKNKDYTIMSNYHLRDKNLTLKAKGLLSFMLSLPEDWDYSLKGLVAICKENKEAIRTALDELKSNEYLEIKPVRSQKGQFEYEYIIFEKPRYMLPKIRNSPYTDFPDTEEPNTENPPQINTNNKIDIIDKIDKKNIIGKNLKNELEEVKHNYLTLELINSKYISENDITSFYFDDLFQNYLSEGYNYKQLYKIVNYVVSKIKERDFKDEDGKEITNRYGYLKKSIESNLRKFEFKELYSENISKELESEER